MTVRILLLFLFCNSFVVSACFCQQLEKNMLARSFGLSRFDIEECTGNIKEIKHNYYELDSPPPFHHSLLAYHEKPITKYEYFFNRKGQITTLISRFTRHNEEEDRLIDYEYTREYKYEKNRLVKINHYKYDTLYASHKELENIYDNEGRLIKVVQTDTLSNSILKENLVYSSDFITSTIVYSDTTTNINKFINDENWTLLSSTTTDKENNLLSFSKYNYDNKGKLECRIYAHANLYSPYYTGSYIEYKYNNRGVLKREKVFNLVGQSIEGIDEFRKRKLESKTSYREKRIDGILIRRKTFYKIGEDRRKRTYTLLDHKRNKILDYHERGGLNIYKIIYYD